MIPTSMLWGGFGLFILAMLALDLGVFNRKAHAISFKEAAIWSVIWVSLALLFNAGVYHYLGSEAGAAFLTGYIIEKSLSVDNIFVFLMIFSYFKVPPQYQRKILSLGIIGALVMRAVFIFAGIALIQRFHWVVYLFGGFLIITAIKMVLKKEGEDDPANNPVIKAVAKFIPVTKGFVDGKFIVKQGGKWLATPLLVTLIVVEISDVIFAVDSIPAILAITSDPFIVFSSNVFAILGLRALYFMLAGALDVFTYLHYGLAAILGFVGFKMVIAEFYKVPMGVALGIVAALLASSMIASVVFKPKKAA